MSLTVKTDDVTKGRKDVDPRAVTGGSGANGLKKIHENFVGTLETVHNNRGVCIREVSVLLESLLHLEHIAENIFNNVIFFFYHLKGVRNLHFFKRVQRT